MSLQCAPRAQNWKPLNVCNDPYFYFYFFNFYCFIVFFLRASIVDVRVIFFCTENASNADGSNLASTVPHLQCARTSTGSDAHTRDGPLVLRTRETTYNFRSTWRPPSRPLSHLLQTSPPEQESVPRAFQGRLSASSRSRSASRERRARKKILELRTRQQAGSPRRHMRRRP